MRDQKSLFPVFILVSFFLLLTGVCFINPLSAETVDNAVILASSGEEYVESDESSEMEEEESVSDPLESMNRVIFDFNDFVYFKVIKPVSKGYSAVTPEGMRVSVRNFFHNILFPIRFVNEILQGKMKDAGIELSRFGINSTLGMAGLFDVANYQFSLESKDEDAGQTLGFYGIGNGVYIVLPLIGPSTARDAIGKVGDSFLDPISYVGGFGEYMAIHSYKYVNNHTISPGDYETLKQDAFDPYEAIRDAYLQHRESLVKN